MNNETLDPQDARLRDLLRQSRASPPLPPRFEEAVWRRIERTKLMTASPAPLAWLDLWLARLLRPRLVLAGIAALLLVSALGGALSGVATARQAAQERYVAAVAPHALP